MSSDLLRLGAITSDLDHEVELFFAAPAIPHDLFALSTVRGWRKKSARAVCFLQELWVSEMDSQLKGVIPLLNQFDHVFVALYHTAAALREKLDVPVSYMPWSVDAEGWSQQRPVERVIDACAIGKMAPVTHDTLVDWSERTGRYYNYTSTGSATFSGSYRVHRANIRQTLQRSKYFFTYMAKRDFGHQRATQEEFGPRYFEGSAAGAIQIGDAVPSNPAYREHLDWEDAVIEAPFSTQEIPELIEALEANPRRVEAARRRNQRQCLQRHDHLYRWDQVLAAAGLPTTAAMEQRRARLSFLADMMQPEPQAAVRRLQP